MANNFRLTRTFTEDEARILTPRVALSLDKFPELSKRDITVGKTEYAEGLASRFEDYVWLKNPNCSFNTIGHELTHLLQHGRGRTHAGEVTCDIWTMARDQLFSDEAPPYLLKRLGQYQESRIYEARRDFVAGKRRLVPEITHEAEDFVTKNTIKEHETNPYFLIDYLIKTWPQHAEKFRQECVKSIKERKRHPMKYIQYLACDLADYTLREYQIAKAIEFLGGKANPQSVSQFKRARSQKLSEDERILRSLFE